MKKQKQERSAKGESVRGEASASGEPNSVSGPRHLPVPPATTQNFLLVPIPRCATRRELLEAVEKALETHDLPFFDNHNKIAVDGRPESVPGDCKQVDGGMGPGEGLVIFMKQEGWP